jgi:signal transduction histidine kinase
MGIPQLSTMSWNRFLFWDVIFWSLGLGMGWLISQWLQRSRTVSLSNRAIADTAKPETAALSDQLCLSEQLQQTQLAYQLAVEMSQFKASFLARTSHELRSPLNSVISLHQLIISDLCDDPAEEREFVNQAHTAALKMLARLDELIQISKIESGTSPPQLRPLQLAEVLEEIRALTYLQAQNRSLRLEVSLPDLSVYVMADPRWLRQILINLVTTPIALMQEGSIRLSTQVILESEQPESKQAQILIEDQRSITFWQEPDFLPSPSLGLNLIINQMLMQAMGGQLKVLSPSPELLGQAASVLDKTSVSNSSKAVPFTQIGCLLPIVSPDQIASLDQPVELLS